MRIACSARLEAFAVPGIPVLQAGDDLPGAVMRALVAEGLALRDGDVVVVTSKAVSRAEGRFVDLATVEASPRARALALEVGSDERVVELVLRESVAVSRAARDVLVVRHRLGFVCANAGIDLSNARPSGTTGPGGPWALLLPAVPDDSAEALRSVLARASGAAIGVVVSDSFGRPFRLGTVGAAIGVAGLPALWDRRGESDLFGRRLEHTETALADQVAAVADLVAGQADEGRAAVVVRGLSFEVGDHGVRELLRPADRDLYA
ncbi:MAG TPA: coenzyme F420-0:L-glutamate ligase [Polyangiaceae bacterium]|jgi:coenzyme F420-0:L-glutamate ligase/coenzyme F420-1:gamma-L-glutamate ligase